MFTAKMAVEWQCIKKTGNYNEAFINVEYAEIFETPDIAISREL